MNQTHTPRLVLTRGQISWLAEFPDNTLLNEALMSKLGEVPPIPVPYTRIAEFDTVRNALQVKYPDHMIQRGLDFNPSYFEVMS